MSRKQKRSKAESIAKVKRSIRKFGDSDGSRKTLLRELSKEA